jgi:hypothetical protein
MALTSCHPGRSRQWHQAKVQLETALFPMTLRAPSRSLVSLPSGTSKTPNRNCNNTISWLGTSASPIGGATLGQEVEGRLAAALVGAQTWLISSVRLAPEKDLARPAFKGNKKRKRSKCSMMNRLLEQKLCR